MAGRVATSFAGKAARRWDKPDGAGPVTEADMAVNHMLVTILRAARPDYGWLSEETEDTAERLDRERVFVVDPIDGTRSFVEGSKTWAHSLAVVEQGEVSAAVIFLPQRDLIYAAARGEGATLNGAPIAATEVGTAAEATVLAARPAMQAHLWRSGAPAFTRSYRPSLAYRLGLVAEARFDGMLTLRPSWEWDIAAGCLIVSEAGGICSDRAGRPLRFNNPSPLLDGVIAAGASLHAELLAALTPA